MLHKPRLCFTATRSGGIERLHFGELGRTYELEPSGRDWLLGRVTAGRYLPMWAGSRADCLAEAFADAALHA